jgi:hypothetical protein
MGEAILHIRQNKIHQNGGGQLGAGIDVRHASGDIQNNLVYKNQRAGIRFGWENLADPHITDIRNNTVVNNGTGGIVYDDLAGNFKDPPAGDPPGPLNIKNNISTNNTKAGIRACFDMTEGSEERDYNLVYVNFGWGSNPDCGWSSDPVGDLNNLRCANQQYGGCGSDLDHWPNLISPHDKMADPLFANMGADDYTLQSGSPAEGSGEGGADMGAYDGNYPLVDSEIPDFSP